MQQHQSFQLGWLIIRNLITAVQQVLQLALLQPILYVSSFVKYIIHYDSHLFQLSGRYFEYMEFPNERRTEIQKNNNFEPHFVSVRTFLFFSPSHVLRGVS